MRRIPVVTSLTIFWAPMARLHALHPIRRAERLARRERAIRGGTRRPAHIVTTGKPSARCTRGCRQLHFGDPQYRQRTILRCALWRRAGTHLLRQTRRYRLSRGGDRHANSALHRIGLQRNDTLTNGYRAWLAAA